MVPERSTDMENDKREREVGEIDVNGGEFEAERHLLRARQRGEDPDLRPREEAEIGNPVGEADTSAQPARGIAMIRK